MKTKTPKIKIEQWRENHRVSVAINDAPIEVIENRFVMLKREKKAYDAEQEERRIQRRLEEERRILEILMEMKKKEEKEKEEKKNKDKLLNDCKFSKTKLPTLVITKFDGTHFGWFRF